MIDEHELREVLHRRADGIAATPGDLPRAVRKARRRLARTAALSAGAIVALSVVAVATVGRFDRSTQPIGPSPVHTPTPLEELPRHPSTSVVFLDVETGETTEAPEVLTRMPNAPEFLTNGDHRDRFPASFRASPDGRFLAFGSSDGEAIRLFVARTDGTGLRQLTFGDTLVVGPPAWSPDGSKIVFDMSPTTDEPRLGVVEVETAELSVIVVSRPGTTGDRTSIFDPSFTSDGESIVFTQLNSDAVDLWRIPVTGGPAELILEDALLGAVSPDGSMIAFWSSNGRRAEMGTLLVEGPYVIDEAGEVIFRARGGGNAWPIQSFPGMTLAWSPDGTRVALGTEIIDVASGSSEVIRTDLKDPRVGWIDDDTLILEETR